MRDGRAQRDGIRIALGSGRSCGHPVGLGVGIMIRTIVMGIDGGCRRVVICTLREGSNTLQTRNTLELRFCVA